MRRLTATSRVRGHGGTGLHGMPLRRGLLVVNVLDLFVASWRRQFPHGQWSVAGIVGPTTVFPVVHVDHPQADSERSHWRLPRLLTSEPLTAYSTSPCPTAARSPPQARSVASRALPAPALWCPRCVGWPHCAHAWCACAFVAGQCPAVRVVAAGGGSRFSAHVLLAFAPHGCGGDATGLWLLVGRHVAPAGGDAASKFPYTVGFLVESQCMWVRASALVSQAPVLPGHSTDGVRPPHGALGPAVFVLELL